MEKQNAGIIIGGSITRTDEWNAPGWKLAATANANFSIKATNTSDRIHAIRIFLILRLASRQKPRENFNQANYPHKTEKLHRHPHVRFLQILSYVTSQKYIVGKTEIQYSDGKSEKRIFPFVLGVCEYRKLNFWLSELRIFFIFS